MKQVTSIRRNAAGIVSVTVKVVDGDVSAAWTVKTRGRAVKDTVSEARAGALKALGEASS